MFIQYKNKQVINVANIIDIFRVNSDKDFDRHNYCQEMGRLYVIQFRSIDMGEGRYSDSLWTFETRQERDEVYQKVLKMIEVKEIL